MMVRMVGAVFSGGCFMIFNALLLIYAGFWLQFSVYERQILQTNGNFTIPGGSSRNSFDTIDTFIYQAMPLITAVLLLLSSVCLFVHVRLSK